jgi:hypothetical protein
MTKRTFAPTEWFHLTELSHAAVLSGLLAARRWTGGELKFQGGTSLHLVYGSPRFSEDLDFVTATTKGLQGAMRAAAPHVEAAFRREFPKLTATVKVRDEEGVPYPRNPRLFTLTLSEPDWFQSLKVKVEFFIIPEQICAEYEAAVRPFAPLWPNLRVDLPQVNIETASMMEILCDKLHALGDRARLKERDVFDLWWICAQTGLTARQAAEQFGLRYEHHVAMYPNGKRLPDLAVSLRERAASLVGNATRITSFEQASQAIARWLPLDNGRPNILASETNIRAMIQQAAQCAVETANVIDGICAPPGDNPCEVEP